MSSPALDEQPPAPTPAQQLTTAVSALVATLRTRETQRAQVDSAKDEAAAAAAALETANVAVSESEGVLTATGTAIGDAKQAVISAVNSIT